MQQQQRNSDMDIDAGDKDEYNPQYPAPPSRRRRRQKRQRDDNGDSSTLLLAEVATQFGEMNVKRQRRVLERCYVEMQREFPGVWQQLVGREGREPHPLVVRQYLQQRFPEANVHSTIEGTCQELVSLLFLLKKREKQQHSSSSY